MRYIIPLAALLLIPSWVRADEMPGYVKGDSYGGEDGGGSRTRIMKAATCPYGSTLTARECARIIEIDRARKRAEARRIVTRRSPRENVYVVERDRDERRDDRRGGRCANRPTSAKGAQRITTAWARSSAMEAWGREVRYDLGETYLGWGRARKIGGDPETPGITCNTSSVGGTLKRCEARAIPCQGS